MFGKDKPNLGNGSGAYSHDSENLVLISVVELALLIPPTEVGGLFKFNLQQTVGIRFLDTTDGSRWRFQVLPSSLRHHLLGHYSDW